MTILIAPLNWGLGHATRCLPLIVRHLRAGDDVVLAGDGDSLTLLRKHFPGLRYYKLAPLELRYSAGRSQVGAVIRFIPKLIRWSLADHRALEKILDEEMFDEVISDNRFGLYTRRCRCSYITHQLLIRMPRGLRWLEPFGCFLHGRIINRFDRCLVPDLEGEGSLAGELSHPARVPARIAYRGALSRFEYCRPEEGPGDYAAVAVLSGLEPQRTLLEQQLLSEYRGKAETLLLVRGKVGEAGTVLKHGNITVVNTISDAELARQLSTARTVISRSGYSSIMDYEVLGLLDKARRGEIALRLIPTPGQPEQEYLAERHGICTTQDK